MNEEENGVFFVHLPSCGGTTFWSLLRSAYGRSSTLHFEKTEAVADLLKDEDAARAQCAGVPVVGGHIPYHNARHLFPERRFISFLRDPVDRAISVYSRRVRNGKWVPTAERGSEDVLDFWDQASTTQCVRFFSPSGEPGPGRPADEILEVLENDFVAFGITAEYDRSLFLMKQQLGWEEVPTYDRRNIGGNKPIEITEAIREGLAERLADEREIFQRAVQLFHAKCEKAETPELLAEMEQYKVRQEERRAELLATNDGQLPYVRQEPNLT